MELKRKIILPLAGIIALVGMSTAAMASDGYRDKGMKGEKRGNHIERMKEKLNLSDEQADKIKAIFKAKREDKKRQRQAHREMRKAMMDLDPSSPQYDAQVDELAQKQATAMVSEIKERAQMRKEVDAILTPEQRSKAKAMHEERLERMKDRMERKRDDRERGERGRKEHFRDYRQG